MLKLYFFFPLDKKHLGGWVQERPLAPWVFSEPAGPGLSFPWWQPCPPSVRTARFLCLCSVGEARSPRPRASLPTPLRGETWTCFPDGLMEAPLGPWGSQGQSRAWRCVLQHRVEPLSVVWSTSLLGDVTVSDVRGPWGMSLAVPATTQFYHVPVW